MKEDVKVSICCLTYNHEKYVRQMIESLVKQKTNFKYEILIHDDASTDNTQAIIKEYQTKYPDIIKPIYQKENQHSKGIRVSLTYQFPRISGEYVAFCEGDDFWCNDSRLQLQYDILEKNSDCSICTGMVNMVSEQGYNLDKLIPNIDIAEGKYSPEQQIMWYTDSEPVLFQLSGIMVRSEYVKKICENLPDFYQIAKVGDRPLLLNMLTCGNLYHLNEIVSCYRWLSIGSWTQRTLLNKERALLNAKNTIEYYKSFNLFTEGRYDKYIYSYVLYNEFFYHFNSFEYRELLRKKYRKLLKNLNNKQKVLFCVGCVSTHIVRFYYKRKETKYEQRNKS